MNFLTNLMLSTAPSSSQDTNTSDQILKRVDAAGQWASNTLDQLATKLGTTVDYLWPTYVQAVVAEGARLIVAGTLLMLLGVLAFVVLRKEAARLCDRVAIMDLGKVIALVTRAELIASLGADTAEVAGFFSWALLMALVFIGAWVVSSGIVSMVAPEPEALTNIVRSIQHLAR